MWPSLEDVDFRVDTRRRALNSLFAGATRHRLLRSGVKTFLPIGRRLTKIFGARSGGYAAVVADGEGTRVACEWLTLRTAVWSPLPRQCSRPNALPPAVCPSVACCPPIDTSIMKN